MANSADDLESGNTDSKIVEVISTRSSSDSAQDQQWSARLAESSLAYGLLLFWLGHFAGIYAMLFADAANSDFTDCS